MTRVRSVATWTEEGVRQEASKYNSKSSFKIGSGGAYEWARRNKIIDELFKGKFHRWDENSVRLEAAKYTSRSDFAKGCASAYDVGRKLGIIKDLFSVNFHQWDEEKVRLEASKYTRIVDFAKGSVQAYNLARRYGIIGELFTKQRITWTEDNVRLEASKYKSKKEFMDSCESAYKWAHRHRILDDLFENQLTQWDEERVRLTAKQFSSKSEFKQSEAGAYQFARKNGILEDLGFTNKAYTFSSTSPATLYLVDTVLNDGALALMFGITNRRHPKGRYNAVDISKMSNRIAYRFPTGAHARTAESNLITKFTAHRIKRGTSPFEEKTGGSGEIIYSTACREVVESFIKENHTAIKSVFSW